MKFKRLIGYSMLLLLLVQPIVAKEMDTLSIIAKKGDINRDAHTVTFKGPVDLKQGTTELHADELIIHFNNQNKFTFALAKGKLARYRSLATNLNKNSKGLSSENDLMVAQAEQIEFYPPKNKVILIGQAMASQGGNQIKGSRIEYDINSGHLITSGSVTERTTIIIQNNQFSLLNANRSKK